MPTPMSLQATALPPRSLLYSSPYPAASGPTRWPRRSASAKISATLLTKNSAGTIAAALQSLSWCDEIVLLDTGSTDATVAIAERFDRVRVHHWEGAFPGFGVAHRRASELARHDWILAIDSDEVVSAELADEIGRLTLDPETVYSLPFHNYLNGRLITTCGWYPERHERLFNRRATNFCASEVHERVQTEGFRQVRLRHPVRHYSYGSLDDFLRKMQVYGHLFARQNAGRRHAGPLTAVLRSAWAFGKSYFLQRGCLQGREGLVISAYKSQTVFWKYLLLDEANRTVRQ